MHRTVGGILVVLTLAAPTGGGKVTAAETMTPLERLASTPKGQLILALSGHPTRTDKCPPLGAKRT